MPGRFFVGFCFLLGLFFTQKKSTAHSIFATAITINDHPPQFHHGITCCHNCRGDEGEKLDQDENRGGFCCKGKGWRDIG